MGKTSLISSFLFITVLFCGCGGNTAFTTFKELEIWTETGTQSFQFEVPDSSFYKIIFHIQHDIDYPYSNFYYNYRLQDDSDSTNIRTVLKEVLFFDPKTGNPLGDGFASTFKHQQVLEDSLFLAGNVPYQCMLDQFMRRDTLTGINRIGISVEKMEID